ncbi:MAG TPA: glycosyltransferase family 9 protein [Euzebyales bacterium]
MVRPDNVGDVLLAGPAIRAVAAGADRVTLWCGPNGRAAAELLPGVDAIVEHPADWIDPDARVVDRRRTLGLVDDLAGRGIDQAVVLTSFHQSPLPTALLLRLAGVPTIAAISEDFPGALLDVRHRVADDVHEVERSLSLVATLGHRLPRGDHGGLEITRRSAADRRPDAARVIVHPGASAPARTWTPERYRSLVTALGTAGWEVTVTGGPGERALTARIAAGLDAFDAGGTTTLAALADLLAGSAALVTGNTGPAHLAAAVGTPVVSLFAPTVPAVRWRPWGVPNVLLGDHAIACAGCRAIRCPLPGHPCLDAVTTDDVIGALRRVVSDRDRTLPPTVVGRPHPVVAR